MKLEDQLKTRKLVVFFGAGGVGKTTIAASAGLEAARRRKTLVLTIDPARRLADALGVTVGSKPVRVRENLDAMMLDTKLALDELVERYAPSPATVKRIMASRFYAQLSDAFAGSEEFVAMGVLHDLYVDGRYDLIIVDTPPSKHAVDFLEVNDKLIRVFESGVVKYLFKPTRFLRMGGGRLAGAFARWTSAEYLEEVAEFMSTFDKMFMDMEGRVRTMEKLLADRSRTGLNVVTVAERESVEQTLALTREITEKLSLAVETCVVNRYYPRLKGMEATTQLEAPGAFREGGLRMIQEATGADPLAARAFLDDALRSARFYEHLARENERAIEILRARLAVDYHMVPALPGSVHSLEALDRLRKSLVA